MEIKQIQTATQYQLILSEEELKQVYRVLKNDCSGETAEGTTYELYNTLKRHYGSKFKLKDMLAGVNCDKPEETELTKNIQIKNNGVYMCSYNMGICDRQLDCRYCGIYLNRMKMQQV